MASVDFPENEREEGDPTMADEPTPAEGQELSKEDVAAFQHLEDADMWGLNKKLTVAGEAKWQDVVGLNHKALFDDLVLTYAIQRSQERRMALEREAMALRQEQNNYWQTVQQRQDQHHAQVQHESTLRNVDYARARNGVQNDNEVAMKHDILAARTIEPTREENIADAAAGAVVQGVETVARAMVDRTQTSAANVSELSAARQVTDVNVLNSLAEVAGIVQTNQAAFQALTNQVAELVGTVQALMAAQKTLAAS